MAATLPGARRPAPSLGPLMRVGPGCASAAALVLLALAILLAYLPAVAAGFGFVSDDFMILQRLEAANGLRGAAGFFSQSYYEYYRPMGFLSFAVDWTLWRDWPAGYHATSILLHLCNTLLVFLLARRMLGVEASIVAAALFGLHVVNQEAVFWASARFDLLATAYALIALLLLDSSLSWRRPAAAAVFLMALLSKESVVAVPVAAGAYLWLYRREDSGGLLRTFAWLGAAGAVYVWWRQASGLAAVGGAARLPKLAVLAALPIIQLAASHQSTAVARRWLRRHRGTAVAAAAVVLISAGGLALLSGRGGAVLAALNAFGFAGLHLLSPIAPDRWLNPLPGWLAGVGPAAAVGLLLVVWRLPNLAVPALLAFFLAAALLPVSSMTEGSRYLYLASVPVAVFVAWLLSAAAPRAAVPAYSVIAAALIVFGWQVREKGRDWLWASDMTSHAVATIVEATGPGCRGAQIVLATAPVRVRGVYSNINAEGLAALGDCRPASVATLLRLGHHSPTIAATLAAEGLTMRIEPYSGGIVTSSDLQHFNIQVMSGRPTVVSNPMGRLETAPDGSVLVVRQAFDDALIAQSRWFVFTRGRLEVLRSPAPPGPSGQGLP